MIETGLKVKFKQISRTKEILSILYKYGLGDYINHSPVLQRFIPQKRLNKLNTINRYERIRIAIEELGPTFIKFGQLLADRSDLIPNKLCIELEKLQDKVPPFPKAEAIALIEEEMHRPIDEIFAYISEEHIGAASIAQVYKADLITGEQVVIKVRRPGIESIIYADLQLMEVLVRRLENRNIRMKTANISGVLTEFRKSILQEIDFTIERNSLELFADFFRGEPEIYVPKSYPKFSSKKILTMEYIDGTKLSKTIILRQKGFDTAVLASRGCKLFFAQIFKYGFFHGDPHPGNIFVLDDGRICFIDFGLMGHISQRNLNNLATFMIAYVRSDARMMTDSILELCNARDSEFKEQLIDSVDEFIFESQRTTVNEVNIGDFLQGCMDVVVRYNIVIPSSLYLLGKSLLTIQSLANLLNPEFNINKEILPYAEELVMKRYSPKGMLNEALGAYEEYKDIMHKIPRDTADIIHKIKEGKLKLDHEHKGLEPFMRRIDVLGKRMSAAIIVAALIVGSGNISEFTHIQYVSEITFSIGAVVGIYLLWDILRGK